VMNADGTLAQLLPFWQRVVTMTRWSREAACIAASRSASAGGIAPRLDLQRDDARAARLRRKNRFPGSGARSVGRHRLGADGSRGRRCARARTVRGVRLPSRFTSAPSLDDAEETRRCSGCVSKPSPSRRSSSSSSRR
jgi:hypothetical protein